MPYFEIENWNYWIVWGNENKFVSFKVGFPIAITTYWVEPVADAWTQTIFLTFYFNINILINTFLLLRFSWLPVVEDNDESPHVYGYLCDLIQSNHVAVLGANNSNLPRILQIIAGAFDSSVIAPKHEVGSRMLQIVKQLESNQELFKACYEVLTHEQREALKEAFSELMSSPVP